MCFTVIPWFSVNMLHHFNNPSLKGHIVIRLSMPTIILIVTISFLFIHVVIIVTVTPSVI